MTNLKTGLLFDVQRFSIHDGPGIRTTFFFKGCSLRCPWCHNPESISAKEQLKYDPKRCDLCKKCIDFVQGDGISIVDGKLKIDFQKHEENFALIDICPSKAYGKFGQRYSVDELSIIALKDKDYYTYSQGGVTFSGGEAINQMEFLCELGPTLKSHGIHICLDISGFISLKNLERSLEFTDIYLLDYKLTNKSDFKSLLGQDFDCKVVLDFLEEKHKEVILRCPIIPSINDTEDHFKVIADYSNQYSCISYVDILPYHNLIKRENFNYINQPKTYAVPNTTQKESWILWLKKHHIKKGVIEGDCI